MIQLYAFVRGLRELPDVKLKTIVLAHALTAVVGPAEGDEHDDVVRHGLLVQALVESADAVLPARFGERFDDTSALIEAVEEHCDELQQRLADVEGCVELAVRVGRAATGETTRGLDGSAYMRARLRTITADAAAAEALHALLRRRARDTVVTPPVTSQLLHDACYLVERDRVDEFARSVETYASAHPELSLVCTGPWAPASFAGER
jgi:hypothetical protein